MDLEADELVDPRPGAQGIDRSMDRARLLRKLAPITMGEILERVASKPGNTEQFGHILVLFVVAVVLPVTTVECERGFSYMKLLVTRLRSSLNEERVDQLMRIILCGPGLEEAEKLQVPTLDGELESFFTEVFKTWKRMFDRQEPFPFFAGYQTQERTAEQQEANAKMAEQARKRRKTA